MTDFNYIKESPRLRIVPCTLEMAEVALDNPAELSRILGAGIAPGWPHEFLDQDAMSFMMNLMEANPGKFTGWLFYLIIQKDLNLLIGSVGYKGPAGPDGCVEIGYGLTEPYQRQGYGSEAALAMVEAAFGGRSRESCG